MILITSAAYVNSDLQPEFGALPAAFVPIANVSLYTYQIKDIQSTFPDEDVYISIPKDFNLPENHRLRIESLGAKIILSRHDLDLRSSILSALMSITELNSPVRILHGDTLIQPLPIDADVVSVAQTQDDYPWEVEYDKIDSEVVWCGYFSFSNSIDLIRSLVLSESFTEAIKYYNRHRNLARVSPENWQDFGHANTYFRARQTRTTERSFNSISVSDGVLSKTGYPTEKIQAEATWFDSLPIEMKPHTPAYYGSDTSPDGSVKYYIEYLLSLPLNESFVHSVSHPAKWEQVFDSIDQWFSKAIKYRDVSEKYITLFRDDMIVEKSKSRFLEYASSVEIDIDEKNWYDGVSLPSYRDIIDELILKALEARAVPGLLHGDLCFSNVIFDSRSKQIKLIDPRGKLFSEDLNHIGDSVSSLIGDIGYDVAKLSHSVIGMYDFIVSGDYDLVNDYGRYQRISFPNSEAIRQVQRSYLKRTFGKLLNTKESLPLMCLLFFSMLPLHEDRPDRQKAFLVNGLRCYKEYILEDS